MCFFTSFAIVLCFDWLKSGWVIGNWARAMMCDSVQDCIPEVMLSMSLKTRIESIVSALGIKNGS